MTQNNFILMQVPSKDSKKQNQIYVIKSSNLEEITNVMTKGAREVGRVQTILSKEQFVVGMNAFISDINKKYAVALAEVTDAVKKVGMV